MSRHVHRLIGIAVLVGFAAAIVSAQEATRSSRFSSSEPSPTSSLGGSSISAETSSRRKPAASSGYGGSNLADRLKSIRRSVVDDYADSDTGDNNTGDVSQQQLAPIVTPGQAGPAAGASPVAASPIAAQGRGNLQSVLKRPSAPATSSPARAEARESSPAARMAARPPTRSVRSTPSSRRSTRSPAPQRYERVATRRGAPSPLSGDSITLRGVGPQLEVETTGPRAILIGAAADYRITLRNEGATPASGVSVRIVLPESVDLQSSRATQGAAQDQPGEAGGTELIWRVAQLPANASEQLDVTIVPRTGSPFDLQVDWAMHPVTAAARIEVQQPSLQLQLSGPTETRYGETAVCIVTLSNPGTGPAENVSLALGPGGQTAQTRQIGDLAPGDEKKIEIELTTERAGLLELFARAAAEGGLSAEAAHRLQVLRANLNVRLDGPPLKFAGSEAEYHIVVANTGDASARGVTAGVLIPAGASYVSGLEGVESSGQQLRWKIGDIEPGMERVFNVRCLLETAGDKVVEVRVVDESDLAAANSLATRVEAIADLKLIVNDPKGPKPVGEEVVYEVRVANRGAKAAELVRVVAQFSEGIEPTSAEGASAEIADGQVVFDPIPHIGPGQEAVLRVKAQADADGNHRFRAEVRCDDPETRLVAEDTTRYFNNSGARVGRRPATTGGSYRPR